MTNKHNVLIKIMVPLLLGLVFIVAQGCSSSDEDPAPTGTVKISGTSDQ